jgi:deoxyribonuclease-4
MGLWIGPAGVPTVSKERSTLGGLKTVSELNLNAMEVEFVRRVGMSNELAREVGELAEKSGIRLSVHAPYFINLCSLEEEKLEASKKRIMDSVERANAMKADIVVFHPAYYGKLAAEEAYQKVKDACSDLLDRVREIGIKGVRLGLETTGKVSQFGTLEEIVRICRELKGCSPVIDWAHIYARSGGRIDYPEIFESVSVLKPKHLHTHFSCIEFSPVGMTGKGNERRHLNLDAKRPGFEELAKEIVRRKIDITIISESPSLEQDALRMREIFKEIGFELF